VGTLNIWGQQGPWEARRVVLRRQLEALALDAIGLQEVVRFDATGARFGVDPATSTDQAKALADELGLHACFGAALDLGSGYSFGNAILSRFPLRDPETIALPGASEAEPRAAISALLATPFGSVPFFSTHLSWKFDEGALRLRQVLALVQAVDRRHVPAAYPPILVGDFNAEPASDEMRFLRGLHVHEGQSTYFIDTFAEVGAGEGATFCRRNAFSAAAGEPDRRIDYVLVRGRDPRGWGRPISGRLAFDQPLAREPGEPPLFASDHFGVVAELTIPVLQEAPIAS
jgi:endonuclease/exonuclease/phosphatase family metal-dependent hydrolase